MAEIVAAYGDGARAVEELTTMLRSGRVR